jgi:hypothetical protein
MVSWYWIPISLVLVVFCARVVSLVALMGYKEPAVKQELTVDDWRALLGSQRITFAPSEEYSSSGANPGGVSFVEPVQERRHTLSSVLPKRKAPKWRRS